MFKQLRKLIDDSFKVISLFLKNQIDSFKKCKKERQNKRKIERTNDKQKERKKERRKVKERNSNNQMFKQLRDDSFKVISLFSKNRIANVQKV